MGVCVAGAAQCSPSGLLVLARSPPGSLTAAQEEQLGKVLPEPMLDMLRTAVEIVPENPEVVEMKKIVEKLGSIEAKLEALQLKSAE